MSGYVKKQKGVDLAVTKPTEYAPGRFGVCPRVVVMYKGSNNARAPVKFFDVSTGVLTLQPGSLLCQLQEVKVSRSSNRLENNTNCHVR